MLVAKTRFEPAGERLIGEQRIQIHRRLGNADAMALGGDAAVEIGQSLGVIEPVAFGHEGFDQVQHTVGSVGESGQHLMRVDALGLAALIEPALGAGGILGRRQISEGEKIAGFEMRAGLLEARLALGVDKRGCGVGKAAVGIAVRWMALRLHEDRPARAETAEGVVEASRDRDEFGWNR